MAASFVTWYACRNTWPLRPRQGRGIVAPFARWYARRNRRQRAGLATPRNSVTRGGPLRAGSAAGDPARRNPRRTPPARKCPNGCPQLARLMVAVVDDELAVRPRVRAAQPERVDGDADVGGGPDDIGCGPGRVRDCGNHPRTPGGRLHLDEPAELPLDCPEHRLLPIEQGPPDAADVPIEVAIGDEATERPLLNGRRAGIDGIEGGDERLAQGIGQHGVAEPHAAVEERLEGAEVDHPSVLVEALEADRRRTAEDQVVGPRVLDDDGAGCACPGQEPEAAGEGHRYARRELDRRRDHRDSGVAGQLVGPQAVRVDRHDIDLGARDRDRPAEDRIARVFDDDPPVRPEPEPSDGPDADHRARQDDDLGRLAVGAASGAEMAGDRRAEERIACGLEGGARARGFGEPAPLLAEQPLESRPDAQIRVLRPSRCPPSHRLEGRSAASGRDGAAPRSQPRSPRSRRPATGVMADALARDRVRTAAGAPAPCSRRRPPAGEAPRPSRIPSAPRHSPRRRAVRRPSRPSTARRQAVRRGRGRSAAADPAATDRHRSPPGRRFRSGDRGLPGRCGRAGWAGSSTSSHVHMPSGPAEVHPTRGARLPVCVR